MTKVVLAAHSLRRLQVQAHGRWRQPQQAHPAGRPADRHRSCTEARAAAVIPHACTARTTHASTAVGCGQQSRQGRSGLQQRQPHSRQGQHATGCTKRRHLFAARAKARQQTAGFCAGCRRATSCQQGEACNCVHIVHAYVIAARCKRCIRAGMDQQVSRDCRSPLNAEAGNPGGQ